MADTMIDLSNALSLPGHDAECLCTGCMMLDMDAHVSANGGTVYEAEHTDPERMRFMAPGTRSGRGFVRHISAKQANFLRMLIATRETAGITIYPGQTLDPTKVNTMGLPAARALIDKLLNAPEIKNTPSVRMATEGQKRFITSLNSQLSSPILTETDISKITFAEVNNTLDMLKSKIANERNAPKATKAATVITPGIYRNEESGEIFKVYKARGGSHLLCKKMIDDEFVYQGAANRFIRGCVRVSIDEAKEYGRRTGSCMICSRELTNPESITNGIGPICASKF